MTLTFTLTDGQVILIGVVLLLIVVDVSIRLLTYFRIL